MKTLIWIALFSLLAVNLFGRSTYKIENNSVLIDVEGMGKKSDMLRIEIWSNSTVKIINGMKQDLSENKSLISKGVPVPVKFKVAYSGTNVEITTRDLVINVEENGLVRIFNREGSKLLIESDRSFKPSSAEEGAFTVNQRFFLSSHEHLFGFGQNNKQPRYSLRNTSFDVLMNNESEIASPVFFSEKGYAVIWDNYSATNFTDAKGGLAITSEVADEVQYFFVYGPDFDKIIAEVRSITGKAVLLPRWAYTFWLSPSIPDVAALTEKCQSMGIPADLFTDPNPELYQKEKEIVASVSDGRYKIAQIPSKQNEAYMAQLQAAKHRPCFPSLSGYPGSQSFGSFSYADDIAGCWSTLKNQVSAGLNISLAGQPYWSTNVGGIASTACSGEPKSELLARWYQFAAFTPVFQISQTENLPWNAGAPGEPAFEAVKKAIIMRFQLLPYTYSIAGKVVNEDYTMMRSLVFNDYKNEKLHDIDQQYMFGSSLMVCPVTDAEVKSKKIYLPDNSNWYNFWTGNKLTGGAEIMENISLDNIPVYVKEGSIIPLTPVDKNSTELKNSMLEIRIYPGADGEFVLYEDENDGSGYLTGAASRIKFTYSEKDKSLEIGAVEGTYPGIYPNRSFRIIKVSEGNGVGSTLAGAGQDVDYKGKKVKISCK